MIVNFSGISVYCSSSCPTGSHKVFFKYHSEWHNTSIYVFLIFFADHTTQLWQQGYWWVHFNRTSLFLLLLLLIYMYNCRPGPGWSKVDNTSIHQINHYTAVRRQVALFVLSGQSGTWTKTSDDKILIASLMASILNIQILTSISVII